MLDDFILPFTIGAGAVRGRVARLGAAIDAILAPHGFPDSVAEIVGEATTLTALMGAALKFDGKFIFQARGAGDVSLLVADYSTNGDLRATASLAGSAKARGFGALLGQGHIAMTVDQGADMERYQGVTPIEGASLEAAAIAYFTRSEQIPTAIKLAVGKVSSPGLPPSWRAGGVIAQFVPADGGARERGETRLHAPEEAEAWERAAAFLNTTQADELLDPTVSSETLLYRLFHEDGARIFDRKPLRAACSCSAARIGGVLARYSADELADLVEDGAIRVSCEFCRRTYLFDEQAREIAQ